MKIKKIVSIFLCNLIALNTCHICLAMRVPAVDKTQLRNRFQNPSVLVPYDRGHVTVRNDLGDWPICYHQDSNQDEPREVWVMNHAGAVTGHQSILMEFSQIFKDCIEILPAIERWLPIIKGIDVAKLISEIARGGVAFGVRFLEVKYKLKNATELVEFVSKIDKIKKLVTEFSTKTGITEKSIFDAITKFVKWVTPNPWVIATLGIVAILICTEIAARDIYHSRMEQNVLSLFQEMYRFLVNRRYKNGNLITFAIDKRSVHIHNMFSSNAGAWVDFLVFNDLPNTTQRTEYYLALDKLKSEIGRFIQQIQLNPMRTLSGQGCVISSGLQFSHKEILNFVESTNEAVTNERIRMAGILLASGQTVQYVSNTTSLSLETIQAIRNEMNI